MYYTNLGQGQSWQSIIARKCTVREELGHPPWHFAHDLDDRTTQVPPAPISAQLKWGIYIPDFDLPISLVVFD